MSLKAVTRTPAGLNVRVTVRYPAPADAKVRDVLGLFRSAAWVNFMVRYVVPYLKTSTPVNKEVLENLEQISCSGDDECVICMNAMNDAVKLPCGHIFHTGCIDAWLRMRSTCPTCRHRFQNEFSGRYAFRGINTALIVDDVGAGMSPAQLQDLDLCGKTVKAIVHVSLIPVAQNPDRQTYPCELNAIVVPQSKLTQHIEARVAKRKADDCAVDVKHPRYKVPAGFTMSDVLSMLHTPAWVAFITRYIVPYLKHSTPANKTVWENLCPAPTDDGDCAVCMQALDATTVRVACGHLFHSTCIETWLKLRSTCPTCRHQFPKEVSGSFAIRAINTAVVLPDALVASSDVMAQEMLGETLSTIVRVTLVQLSPTAAAGRFPCELNAAVIRAGPSTAVALDNAVKRSHSDTTRAPAGKRTRSC
ncbi:hypothetical protein ACHHYP_13210 [Achlya hypogyna]|uniref:RING-type domain-containing protein n=1 Tax=Achlya hypogyna TaxID=1202772 RepID=A0A1V9ZG73_ACHHY|nr:hypothetical protein ACHHYP_13210 [Achlya hypogyna]